MVIEIQKDLCNIAGAKKSKTAIQFLKNTYHDIPSKCYIFVSVCK